MMFRYLLRDEGTAGAIEGVVEEVLAQGYRTPDIAGKDSKVLGTQEMGDRVKLEAEKGMI